VELNVSTPVKIFALAALVLGLAAAGALTVLGPSGGGSSASEVNGVKLDDQGRVIATPKMAETVAKEASDRAAVPRKALSPPARPKKAVSPPAPKPRELVAENGLPRVVANALLTHEVVVVALYTPRGKTDPIGFSEAKQGASLARAGFVPVNVFNARISAPLMAKLGAVLRAPTVLVFNRSGVLTTRLDGFADRETVAQAAHNAAL
jgi:hypothetical protein